MQQARWISILVVIAAIVVLVLVVAFVMLTMLTSGHQHEATNFNWRDVHRAALQTRCGDEGENKFGSHADEAITTPFREPLDAAVGGLAV